MFQRLRTVLHKKTARPHNTLNTQGIAILSIIGPLVRFIHGLPGFALGARHLDRSSHTILRALLSARRPSSLLFGTLPRTYELTPVIIYRTSSNAATHACQRHLMRTLHRVGNTCSTLLTRYRSLLCDTFNIRDSHARLHQSLRFHTDQILNGYIRTDLGQFTETTTSRTINSHR